MSALSLGIPILDFFGRCNCYLEIPQLCLSVFLQNKDLQIFKLTKAKNLTISKQCCLSSLTVLPKILKNNDKYSVGC